MEVISTVMPCASVISVKLLYASLSRIPLNCDTTQKYESLACETVMAPPPMAKINVATEVADVNPARIVNGASKELVIMIADVEDPCADFKTAPKAKAISINSMPPDCEPAICSFKIKSMPLDFMTAPNEPPAPVIRSITPASFNASEIQAGDSCLCFFEINRNAQRSPADKAMAGFPIIWKMFVSALKAGIIVGNVAQEMSRIGSSSGRNARTVW